MLITLGAKTEASDEPMALLASCHARIRRFLALAQALAERDLPAAEAVDVAGQVVRYFRVAFPLHIADEDLSFAPRLRGREPAIDAALAQMSREHPVVDAALEPLVVLCEAVAREGGSSPRRRQEIAAFFPSLSEAFEAHLVLEERVLFPAATRLLDAREQRVLREEMRGRRQPTPR